MTEFVLYGGKGGVGKTTCAAATALELANRGERTIVISTDPAHSLGDCFDVAVGEEPTEIEHGLWGVEPSAASGQETYRRIVTVLAREFRSAGLRLTDEDVEELFAAGMVPGSDELAALQLVGEYAAEGEWDRVVIDTAPTGHTLRLLALPDVLTESLSTVSKVRHEVRSLVASARSLVFGPAAYLGREERVAELERLDAQLSTVSEVLRDPERTDFRVVLVPERLAIAETERLVAELRRFRVPVDTLIVNRVLETVDPRCERCSRRKALQEERIAELRQAFPNLGVRRLPDLGNEVADRAALARLGAELG
ncbi:ArsA family ATPase [Haloarculaceae archaeon H-GB11]|nr:ArsA family ATPase [Haloarculaceae archaeon H-GB11]